MSTGVLFICLCPTSSRCCGFVFTENILCYESPFNSVATSTSVLNHLACVFVLFKISFMQPVFQVCFISCWCPWPTI